MAAALADGRRCDSSAGTARPRRPLVDAAAPGDMRAQRSFSHRRQCNLGGRRAGAPLRRRRSGDRRCWAPGRLYEEPRDDSQRPSFLLAYKPKVAPKPSLTSVPIDDEDLQLYCATRP